MNYLLILTNISFVYISYNCSNRNQFEIGKTYEIKDNNLKIRSKGFHFCEDIYDIFKYYRPKIHKMRRII